MLSRAGQRGISSLVFSRTASCFLGRRAFSEDARPIEYEIVKNMETFPLFSEKTAVEEELLVHV